MSYSKTDKTVLEVSDVILAFCFLFLFFLLSFLLFFFLSFLFVLVETNDLLRMHLKTWIVTRLLDQSQGWAMNEWFLMRLNIA